MPHRFRAHPVRRGLLAVSGALVIGASLPLSAGAAPPSGFVTSRQPMLLPGAQAPTGTTITPLMTVGDTLGDYMFEAIPDGIAVKAAGKRGAQVYVNHETSTVPFGYNLSPTTSNSFNDYNNSQVSKLMLRQNKAGEYRIIDAEMVIDTGAGYHRFCSNYLATTDGFEDRPMLFTNEEGIDWVAEDVFDDGLATNLGWTTGTTFEGADGARQIGAVVAYDLNSQTSKPIWGMGRHNHENSVAIPVGYPFLLSGDDAFNQHRAQSQVYAYIAPDADAVWNDDGELWAFVPDEEYEDVNDYYDFAISSTDSISGHFVQVPKEIATGKNSDGSDMMAADVPEEFGGPYPLPPNDGSWQRAPGQSTSTTATIPGIDGPQWVLEHWGDEHNAFQFLRIEDIAFDKRDGMSNVVYLVDSGRGLRPTDDLTYAPWRSTNGRIWKMVLDPNNPTTVLELSILIEGDDAEVKTLAEIHQPDNIESTLNGLLITEDPGSAQQFTTAQQTSDAARATTARLMYYDFDTGNVTAVLKVDQSADEGSTDEDTSAAGNWGAWETSGIVDVSSIFGPDTFLINVQAHSLYVDISSTLAPDNLGSGNGADWLFKREGGQLLLVTLPGV